MGKKLLVIVGPTAVGKTDYSIERALALGSPVISCDSRQIYKEMSIGTAVPSASQLSAVKHYFIHSHSVTRFYTAGQYEVDALALIDRLFAEGHETLVMSGGSGFYVDAVCKGLSEMPETDLSLREELMERLRREGLGSVAEQLGKLDPAARSEIDISNPQRVVRALEVCILSGKPFSSFKSDSPKKRNFEIETVCVERPREVLYERINARVLKMMDDGLLEEVRSLEQYRELPALRTVGYKEIFDYFDGKTSLDEAVALIQQHTRNYAKRQLTYWRRYPHIRHLAL